MNKGFLNKVLGHIVKETIIDFTVERIYTPFGPILSLTLPLYFSSSFISHFSSSFSPPLFSEHCMSIYSLNKEETDYVWKEYKDIIKDKMNNKELV